PGGDADPKSVTVTVKKKPVIKLSADKTEIQQGDQVTLTWTITDATSANLAPKPGAVDPKSGSFPDTPQQDTTYTLTASGPGGAREPESVTVKVTAKPKAYTITLESSGGGNLATTDQVTVDGTVSPVPPTGTTESVSIGVNGSPVMSVPVASDGSFV